MNFDRIIAIRNEKTVYRDADKCIKTFISGYSKSDIFNEALNLTRIEETDINTPKLFEVAEIDGRWSIVTEYIKGKTLARLMKEQPERKKEYMEMFVDLHISLHNKSCPLLSRQKDIMNRKIISCDLDANTRYDLFERLDSMPRHTKLCHGDFEPANVIISEDGTPYIVDWSHASIGSASADAARTYLLFWMRGDISGAELYLKSFCEKTGTEVEYVKAWMPLVAAAQSVKCNEKEREFLLSWCKTN